MTRREDTICPVNDDSDLSVMVSVTNRILPLSKGGMSVPEVDFENLEKVFFGNNVKPYEYYSDNGETKDYEGHIREIKA